VEKIAEQRQIFMGASLTQLISPVGDRSPKHPCSWRLWMHVSQSAELL